MSRKCPACGFDSEDAAAWCDFCKEPFEKKAKSKPQPSAPQPAAAAPAPAPAVDIAELKKLPPEELLKRLPAELSKDVSADNALPKVPPWFKPMAYVFVAVLTALTAGLIAVTVMKASQARPSRSAPPGAR